MSNLSDKSDKSIYNPKTTCKRCMDNLEQSHIICDNGWFYCNECHQRMAIRDPFNHGELSSCCDPTDPDY